jgi:hypothetical protein
MSVFTVRRAARSDDAAFVGEMVMCEQMARVLVRLLVRELEPAAT